jgi:hypothetical protein
LKGCILKSLVIFSVMLSMEVARTTSLMQAAALTVGSQAHGTGARHSRRKNTSGYFFSQVRVIPLL